MNETSTRQFVGDGEHDLRLTPEMVIELERIVGRGIGAILNRVVGRDFSYFEIVETIRLALIGGGMKPERAASLTDAYVRPAPIFESFPIALAVLDALSFGQKQKGQP